MSILRKTVFLDRDGTINVDVGYVHTKDEFVLIDGVVEGLKILQNLGYDLIIITNQSGIGRGYFTEEEYLDFQEYVRKFLYNKGISLLDQFYCPHVEKDNCSCRKPLIGMYEMAAEKYDIDWAKSYVIGDKQRDLSICKYKPVKGYLISDNNIVADDFTIVRSLYDATKDIEALEKSENRISIK